MAAVVEPEPVEHAGRCRAVEVEQDAERDHLALGRRQLAQRPLERPRQALREHGLGLRLAIRKPFELTRMLAVVKAFLPDGSSDDGD